LQPSIWKPASMGGGKEKGGDFGRSLKNTQRKVRGSFKEKKNHAWKLTDLFKLTYGGRRISHKKRKQHTHETGIKRHPCEGGGRGGTTMEKHHKPVHKSRGEAWLGKEYRSTQVHSGGKYRKEEQVAKKKAQKHPGFSGIMYNAVNTGWEGSGDGFREKERGGPGTGDKKVLSKKTSL